MTMRWHLPSAIVLCLGFSPGAAHSQSVEAVFAAAHDYTVYVEVRVETPFVEDDPGAFFGAGFIVDRERGWVLTNAHVIGHSPTLVTVTYGNGVKASAHPIYIDSFLDAAVLEVDGHEYLTRGQAELDCAHVPAVGVSVGAYGHPNGFKFTGTRGIISGVSPIFGSDGLQTDAPINAGNSGGPLIRLDTGNVVGINTASLRDSEMQNMNFAVESVYACRMLELLRREQDPRPPVLDVLFYDEDGEPSLVVAHVGEIGARAGLRRGDRIVGVDGVLLEPPSLSELVHRLRGRTEPADLVIERTVGEVTHLLYPMQLDDAVLARRGYLVGGALFAPSNHADAQLLTDAPALMVHYVEPGSWAQSARLKVYDHLVGINGQRVNSIDEIVEVMHRCRTELATFEIIRFVNEADGFSRYVRASLPVEDGAWVAFRTGAIPVIGDAR